MAKKMGTNPLSGLNGLIRSTQEATADAAPLAQSAHAVQSAPPAQDAQHTQAAQNAQHTQAPPETPSAHDAQITQAAPSLHSAHKAQETHVTQDVPEPQYAHSAQKTQGRKGHKLPRINMAFSNEHLQYLHAIAGFERMSATQYVNNLIKADMKKREDLYERLNAMRGEGG